MKPSFPPDVWMLGFCGDAKQRKEDYFLRAGDYFQKPNVTEVLSQRLAYPSSLKTGLNNLLATNRDEKEFKT